MILLSILLVLAAGYSYAFYYTGLSLWFYFLWAPLGLLLSFLTFAGFVFIAFLFWMRTDPKGKIRHHILYQVCQMVIILCNIKIKVIGKQYIPKETFVCYANHKSDIDPVALYCALHRTCSAIGKKSLFKIPVIKQCQKVFGAIALDRDNDRAAAKAMIEAIRAVKAGMSYIIFPEGGIKTRDTEEMVNLRAGAYKLVMKSGALLLPVTIIGSSNTKKRKTLLKRVKITIIFHPAMKEEEYSLMNTTELGSKIMQLVNEDIKHYEEQYHC
ncbi:MAG: 1-acyl-sn-glycerol-3-phosphate acyltransferase [Anaeroplasmataceae bacterium]|nr:1-acyl-sn-glycerol-3-phosphate acyltransferase [Anaeroplasmataceae bacterium]